MYNPVYKREVTRSMRAPRMILSVLIFNLLLAAVGVFLLAMTMKETGYGSSMDYSVVLNFYEMIACAEWVLTVIMMPVLTAGAISGERERNTLEVLLTTGIGEGTIIYGKLLAALSIMMTLVISTFPVLSLVFIYGGVRYLGLLQLLVVLMVSAAYVGSICLLFSAFAKTTTFALICSYALLLFLIVGTAFGTYLLQAALGGAAGDWSWLLLMNPLASFCALIHEQVGAFGWLAEVMLETGMEEQGVLGNHFLEISMAVQLVFTGVLLWCAKLGLAPSRRLFGTQSPRRDD
jgi:ABC-type transport system involved in multi-copper enzyme maturation permease subunit